MVAYTQQTCTPRAAAVRWPYGEEVCPMRTMRRAARLLFLVALALLVTTQAAPGAPQAPKTFVALMNAANELPHCGPATNVAHGAAIFHVRDQAAGVVDYMIVANN